MAGAADSSTGVSLDASTTGSGAVVTGDGVLSESETSSSRDARSSWPADTLSLSMPMVD